MENNKIIVIYQSKYGATKKYANWIQEELACDIMDVKACTGKTLNNYDTIIYGGGIYASGIAGISFIKKNYEEIKDKNSYIFAVGASPYDENALNECRKKNLKKELSSLQLFYFRGAFNEDIMTTSDKLLINLLKKAVLKKNPIDYEPWEKALVEAIGKDGDWTSKEQIISFIEYIKTNNRRLLAK